MSGLNKLTDGASELCLTRAVENTISCNTEGSGERAAGSG